MNWKTEVKKLFRVHPRVTGTENMSEWVRADKGDQAGLTHTE